MKQERQDATEQQMLRPLLRSVDWLGSLACYLRSVSPYHCQSIDDADGKTLLSIIASSATSSITLTPPSPAAEKLFYRVREVILP